jgi:copper chaperone
METETLTIEGMSCGHCVGRVTKALSGVPGLNVEDVTVGSARVSFDPGRTSREQIDTALDAAGYTVKSHAPIGR